MKAQCSAYAHFCFLVSKLSHNSFVEVIILCFIFFIFCTFYKQKRWVEIPVLTIDAKSFYFRSAYLLYYFDVHQLMQQEVPNIPQSEINKRISENWKRLSVAEKAYYLEKAKSEKEGMDGVSVIVNVLFVQMASTEGASSVNYIATCW